jgi:hypothetical protein
MYSFLCAKYGNVLGCFENCEVCCVCLIAVEADHPSIHLSIELPLDEIDHCCHQTD